MSSRLPVFRRLTHIRMGHFYLLIHCSLVFEMEKTIFTHRQKLPVDSLTQSEATRDYRRLLNPLREYLLKSVLFLMRLTPLLGLLSCSLFISGKQQPASAKGSSYLIKFNDRNWSERKERRSDYIFEHQTNGQILLANSFCDELQDDALAELAHKTLSTMEDFNISDSSYLTFHERNAYRLSGQGKVDGVEVQLHLLNTRRNNCYFDFVFIDPDSSTVKGVGDFQQFLNSVVFL